MRGGTQRRFNTAQRATTPVAGAARLSVKVQRQDAVMVTTVGGVEGALEAKPAPIARGLRGDADRTPSPRTGTVWEPLDKHAEDGQLYS